LRTKLITFEILFTLSLLIASCAASAGQGPNAWIDQPLDNSRLPEAALFIRAHASDESGIASFTFFIDGVEINKVGADGTRLENTGIEWTPPGGWSLPG